MIDISTTGQGQIRLSVTTDDFGPMSRMPDAIDYITPDEARRISVALAVAVEAARKEAPNV